MPDSFTGSSTIGTWKRPFGLRLYVGHSRLVLPVAHTPNQALKKLCNMSHPVDEILQAQKRGDVRGITSICSAHPWVLKTALRGRSPVLIESTCNQVNQFGGYTGMNPLNFATFVHRLAAENNFPSERIILGGDHLGPSPWQDEPSEGAMTHAVGMVQAYIQAGFTKIHLDTSMKLGGDDPTGPLDFGLVAKRTALLVKAAEAVASPLNSSPLYHRHRSSSSRRSNRTRRKC